MTKTTGANDTFQEGRDPAEQLVNVTVCVTDREETYVDVFENATVYQRLQVCK